MIRTNHASPQDTLFILMISSTALCESQYHTLPSGHRMRYAIYEPAGQAQATIVIAPGRREFIEKKFSEMGREFLERNFRVIIFEWRGQGLSDRFLKGPSRQRDHITDFGIYIDDLRSFFLSVVEPRRQGALIVFGHSMGAHLFLNWLGQDRPDAVAAAFFTAPMLALGPRLAHGVALGIAKAVVEIGFGEHYGPGQHNYGVNDRAFQDNPLTHDVERYSIIARYFDAHPDLTVGGVTYAWLYAALKSMRDERNAAFLKNIHVPVLTITGSKDRVTPPPELMPFLALIPNAENLVLPGSMHDVMNETETVRAEAWRMIDQFLIKIRG